MKISKAVLKSIAIAVAVGVTQASCTKEEDELLNTTSETGENSQHSTGENGHDTFNCPACGRG